MYKQYAVLLHLQGIAAGRYNKPSDATFSDDPIPPQYLHLFDQSNTKEKTSCSVAEHFLKQQGRKLGSVLGDGNCLFRALSFAIHQHQDMHHKLRIDITQMIKDNKQQFKPFIIGPVPIDRHIINMSKLGTWGTQVELIAASTLFRVPIYVAGKTTNSQTYCWRKYSPIAVENVVPMGIGKSHIELIHLNECHFDPVILLCGASEPAIPLREYQGGEIID